MPSLSEHITQYLQVCEYEKRLSSDTLKAYRIDLTQFAAFARDAVVDKVLLGEYAAHLNRHFAPRSVKRKLASIRAFYSFLEEQECVEESPFRRFRLHIVYPKELPRSIPTKTVEAVLREAYGQYQATGDHWALRDILVLELLFDTGMRVSELCKLTPDTFQIGSNGLKLLIHGKGRKERVLQIATTEVVSLAEQYPPPQSFHRPPHAPCDRRSMHRQAGGKPLPVCQLRRQERRFLQLRHRAGR